MSILGIDPANCTPTVPGTAVTGTGITIDYFGNTRGANVSMGAIEVKQGPNAPTNVVATAGVGSASNCFYHADQYWMRSHYQFINILWTMVPAG